MSLQDPVADMLTRIRNAQGIVAGINASLSIENQGTFELKRDEAYIGVLIDDLVKIGRASCRERV